MGGGRWAVGGWYSRFWWVQQVLVSAVLVGAAGASGCSRCWWVQQVLVGVQHEWFWLKWRQ